LSKLSDLVENLFKDPKSFFEDWKLFEGDIVATLELGIIVMSSGSKRSPWDMCGDQLVDWESFSYETAARFAVEILTEQVVGQKDNGWLQSISFIEVSFNILQKYLQLLLRFNFSFAFVEKSRFMPYSRTR